MALVDRRILLVVLSPLGSGRMLISGSKGADLIGTGRKLVIVRDAVSLINYVAGTMLLLFLLLLSL